MGSSPNGNLFPSAFYRFLAFREAPVVAISVCYSLSNGDCVDRVASQGEQLTATDIWSFGRDFCRQVGFGVQERRGRDPFLGVGVGVAFRGGEANRPGAYQGGRMPASAGQWYFGDLYGDVDAGFRPVASDAGVQRGRLRAEGLKYFCF